MATVEKVPGSLLSTPPAFSSLPSAPEADARNAEERFMAYHEAVEKRTRTIEKFFEGKFTNATKIASFKTFVAEHVAHLAARYVTTGRFDHLTEVSTETAALPPSGGFENSPAMRLAMESGFDPDSRD